MIRIIVLILIRGIISSPSSCGTEWEGVGGPDSCSSITAFFSIVYEFCETNVAKKVDDNFVLYLLVHRRFRIDLL